MKKLVIGACCLLLSGCVARSYWMGKVGIPSRPSDSPVDVLLPGEVINRPYIVLGVIQVDGYYGTGTETLIKGAQTQARKHGGDAVVLGEFGQKIVNYTTYVPGQPGDVAAAAASSAYGAAAAVAIRAPTPDKVINSQVFWPTMSAIVLRYIDGSPPSPQEGNSGNRKNGTDSTF